MANMKKMESMTVGELRQYLSNFDDNLPVYFPYPSGDYWRTEIAGQIIEVEAGIVDYSEYYQKPKTVDEEGDLNETTTECVLLR